MAVDTLQEISQEVARIALKIGAIQFRPENPFYWASGYRMPVYNDNRVLVATGFQEIIRQEKLVVEVVAGTATAGIPHATTLANLLCAPLVYVRSKPKDHGTQSQVEGSILKEQKTLVIEDLVSTGGSALNVVQTIRKVGAFVDHCLCIFTYGFKSTEKNFKDIQCQLHALLNFPALLKVAQNMNNINPEQTELLQDWYQDPFTWGERHGFKKS